jgi:hypothetical protein
VTDNPLLWVVGFISDPRWGIPFLLMLEATILWAAWNPRAPATLGARRTSWVRPDGDPVSRMFYALGDERFSIIVRWSRERIEELYEARSGQPLPAIPWGLFRRPDLPDNRFHLRRLTLDLGAIEWDAQEREAGDHIRWAFWRTRERDSTLYKARVDRLLTRAQNAILDLEAAP